MRRHSRCDDFIEDFCDAEAYKEHPLFSKCDMALEIMFYYDDVEISGQGLRYTNLVSLDVHSFYSSNVASSHKSLFFGIALFYYTLGDLPPKHRSALHLIQLVAVVRHSYVKKYGFQTILEPFMEDIKRLESVCENLSCTHTCTCVCMLVL